MSELAVQEPEIREPAPVPATEPGPRKLRTGPGFGDTLNLVFKAGGPGFCQFALNSACNANCGFCGFARDKFPKSQWKFVTRQQAFDSLDILFREGVR